MDHTRTSNQIIRMPTRKLPLNRSSNTYAITTDDPNTLNSNNPRDTDGQGNCGSQCLLTLMLGLLGASVTITAWAWFEGGGGASKPGYWVKLGANSTQYNKSFDSKTIDGIAMPEKCLYYLQGSANIVDAWVDGPDLHSRVGPRGTA